MGKNHTYWLSPLLSGWLLVTNQTYDHTASKAALWMSRYCQNHHAMYIQVTGWQERCEGRISINFYNYIKDTGVRSTQIINYSV